MIHCHAPACALRPDNAANNLPRQKGRLFGRLDAAQSLVPVFRAKRADRIKTLVWDQAGIVLVHKRLEGAKLAWPRVQMA